MIGNHNASIEVAECIEKSNNDEELIEMLLAKAVAREDDSETEEDEPKGYNNFLLVGRLNRSNKEDMEHAMEADDAFFVNKGSK